MRINFWYQNLKKNACIELVVQGNETSPRMFLLIEGLVLFPFPLLKHFITPNQHIDVRTKWHMQFYLAKICALLPNLSMKALFPRFLSEDALSLVGLLRLSWVESPLPPPLDDSESDGGSDILVSLLEA